MTKRQLLEALRKIAEMQADPDYDLDLEVDHLEADTLLLRYIDDPLVTEAFQAIGKWYA